jgi:hypothetical protein
LAEFEGHQIQDDDEEKPLEHQPIFAFHKDPFLVAKENTKFPDILSAGVVSAFYSNGLF